ncbi:MAG: hypothetical protein M3R35_06075 [Candidatus Eremiobacteraeota bacterium]|nr:hypothetical protein [Candidatus Eremiobacteraeota bacterium]
MKQLFLAAVLVLGLATAASAQPAGRCTSETLRVRGTPVAATYCVHGNSDGPAGREIPVAVSERYSSPRGSFAQNATLSFIAGIEPSRVIEDVTLDRLGLTGTLHLTLVLRGGYVRIESAILTPGAITIK